MNRDHLKRKLDIPRVSQLRGLKYLPVCDLLELELHRSGNFQSYSINDMHCDQDSGWFLQNQIGLMIPVNIRIKHHLHWPDACN